MTAAQLHTLHLKAKEFSYSPVRHWQLCVYVCRQFSHAKHHVKWSTKWAVETTSKIWLITAKS